MHQQIFSMRECAKLTKWHISDPNVKSSVADPWHFGVDPRIQASD